LASLGLLRPNTVRANQGSRGNPIACILEKEPTEVLVHAEGRGRHVRACEGDPEAAQEPLQAAVFSPTPMKSQEEEWIGGQVAQKSSRGGDCGSVVPTAISLPLNAYESADRALFLESNQTLFQGGAALQRDLTFA
jgi:hypothetical protein